MVPRLISTTFHGVTILSMMLYNPCSSTGGPHPALNDFQWSTSWLHYEGKLTELCIKVFLMITPIKNFAKPIKSLFGSKVHHWKTKFWKTRHRKSQVFSVTLSRVFFSIELNGLNIEKLKQFLWFLLLNCRQPTNFETGKTP